MKHLLSILAFILITFGVQGLNHFVVNVAHYENIDFARAEPIMALGFLTMIVQGSILTLALGYLAPKGARIKDAMMVSLSFGLFLGFYIAVTEPAKYAAPSIPAWIITEGLASTIQFLLFGLVLGFVHQRFSKGPK
ncbi:hypothetical protein GCM10009096_12050 [Parasphingorhabdus litoris]|uniref:DUF1761 domain-containing protein n=1 Tax=Parasphingorhabdus litoris TaxID=394733 RepID=A0ABP3K648_9SPHN|nr:hypothetical protein [Parasphingorhabdus litoris]